MVSPLHLVPLGGAKITQILSGLEAGYETVVQRT